MAIVYSNINDMPVILNASEVSKILRVSRATVYNVMHRQDFPAMQIGKRLFVEKNKLLDWMEMQNVCHLKNNFKN